MIRHITVCLLLFFVFVHSAQATWSQQDLGTIQGLRGIAQSGGNFFAVGNTGQTLRSTDGGLTWSLYDNSASVFWQDMAATGEIIRVVGENGAMRESEDGGKTWTNISVGATEILNDLDVFGDGGLIVGTGGRIIRLHPSAKLWQTVSSPTTLTLQRVQIFDSTNTWVVGQSGTLFYTPDYGISWSNKGKVTSEDLYGVWFTSATTGYVVGKNAVLRKTTDAGVSWTDVAVSGLSNQTLYDIRGSGDRMIAVGDRILLDSTDGGVTWTATSYATENYRFYDAYFDASGSIWVVGTQDDVKSVVLKYETPVSPTPEPEPEPEPLPEPDPVKPLVEAAPDTLIKLPCIGQTEADDPCRSVYFYGSDGKRHAFSNDKVFFTWFEHFDDVINVSPKFMALLPLGKNVTYHPGTRMVKFQSVPTVYAVSAKGVLRAIASEQVATDLYGNDWNQQIDDIFDAFLGNYTFGSKIVTEEDYDVAAEKTSILDLDENW